MLRPLSLATATLLALTSAATYSTSYTLTDDYALRATAKGVEATFADLRGTVVFDPANLPASSFDVSVATASVRTGNKTQDKHARSDNWLDAGAHPRISFVSTAFAKTATGYDVTGDLTIRGRTHAETIAFAFDGETFAGELAVARGQYAKEWGTGATLLSLGPFLFGGLVGDVVAVALRVGVQ